MRLATVRAGGTETAAIVAEAGDRMRMKAMQLSCIAGLAGLPQLTVPAGVAGGLPVGLSFIAGRGHDLRLLSWVRAVQENAAGGKGAVSTNSVGSMKKA